MKLIMTSIAASLLAAVAMAEPPRYTVLDLGVLGKTPAEQSFSPYIASNGLVAGSAATASGPMHAIVWFKGMKFDISALGLGGPNSAAFGVNNFGQAVGQAETTTPNAEDFCGFKASGFASSTACLPFVWQNGVMTKLPTLGGANGVAGRINNRGEVAGYAETATKDPGCPVARFEPVVWDKYGVHALKLLGGDTSGVAAAINDRGQVSGASGTCTDFNPNSGIFLVENRAMLWDSDGTPHDLGNLGGVGGIAGNHACALNNRGQAVGHSELANNTTFHGFLWTEARGMQDLGTLPGDAASLGLGINDAGEVVGASLDPSFTPRPFFWQNNVMTDLNTLITSNPAKLYLLLAESINSKGEIIGLGVGPDGVHGFLAAPNGGGNLSPAFETVDKPILSESVRNLLLRRMRIRER